ncbi:MAG: class I SAM-dependent methyltransferase [Patescibacteria group bacterium]
MPENFDNRDQEENLASVIEVKTDEQKEQEDERRINRDLFGNVNVNEITSHLRGPASDNEQRIDTLYEIKKIEAEIAYRFPKTYGRTAEENLRIAQEVSNTGLQKGFLHDKHRSVALYELAAFSKGDAIAEEDINVIETQLKDKKILILGDDTGSFSEILNSFGAKVIGIEIDKAKVAVAHSGVLSEKSEPQEQVIHGDIGDLTDEASDLYKKLEQSGPFDIIYSHAVFNGGSGIEGAIDKFNAKSRLRGPMIDFGKCLTSNLSSLLNKNGFMLHDRVDLREIFGPYGQRYSKSAPAENWLWAASSGTGRISDLIFISKNEFENISEKIQSNRDWIGMKV